MAELVSALGKPTTDCPNCGYPGRRYKGIYTAGKPCGHCGVTAVFAPTSVSLTMPSYAEAQRLAAERAVQETLFENGWLGPEPMTPPSSAPWGSSREHHRSHRAARRISAPGPGRKPTNQRPPLPLRVLATCPGGLLAPGGRSRAFRPPALQQGDRGGALSRGIRETLALDDAPLRHRLLWAMRLLWHPLSFRLLLGSPRGTAFTSRATGSATSKRWRVGMTVPWAGGTRFAG